jgi:hypothetical protein
MINLVSTVNKSGKVCAKCGIKCHKIRKTCDLYDNPGADANEQHKVEQEKHESSHETEDASVSNVAIGILNSTLQAIREPPIRRSSCKKRSILRRRFRK